MTPAMIKRYIEVYNKRKNDEWEQLEYNAWMNGWYVMNAIACSLNKKCKYPENPLIKQQTIVDEMELTEEEKDKYRMNFLKRLERMEKRFNKAKEKENNFEVIKKQGR